LYMQVFWSVVLVIGALTFALRFSFIHLLEKVKMPQLLESALRFIPASVLAALVLPAILYSGDTLYLSPGNERLLAGTAAALVAWYSGSVLLTILTGMGSLWLLQAAFSI